MNTERLRLSLCIATCCTRLSIDIFMARAFARNRFFFFTERKLSFRARSYDATSVVSETREKLSGHEIRSPVTHARHLYPVDNQKQAYVQTTEHCERYSSNGHKCQRGVTDTRLRKLINANVRVFYLPRAPRTPFDMYWRTKL